MPDAPRYATQKASTFNWFEIEIGKVLPSSHLLTEQVAKASYGRKALFFIYFFWNEKLQTREAEGAEEEEEDRSGRKKQKR